MTEETPLIVDRTSQGSALRFIVLIGIVSLFADMTYEGARSITGPYLAVLGASGAVVGFVAGGGELVGYGLRLVSGYFSDKTGKHWAITIAGYLLNLLSVPLLALAGRWEVAALLMILERTGKAVRNPPRDAMLSYASHQIGPGWAFGLHEALDQIGAVIGPLAIAAALLVGVGYAGSFRMLLVPALLALGFVVVARVQYPQPRNLAPTAAGLPETKGFPPVFWSYLAAVALIAAGFLDFPLIAYHFQKTGTVEPGWIPVYYAVAMGVDGLAALLFGRLFDRWGIRIMASVGLISGLVAPFVFLGDFSLGLVGMVCWGIGMGAQESVMRAALARMVSTQRRATAYGVFNAGYGLFWFVGSAIMGLLYDSSLPALIGVSVALQLAAVPIFFAVGWNERRTTVA